MGTTKTIVIRYTMEEALARGLIGCANCIKATKGMYSHPPNNHFLGQKGGCAQCSCMKFEMKPKGGKLVLPKKREKADPVIQYASENADMVSIIRRQIDEIGGAYTCVPFLDDCISMLINSRKEAREVLEKVISLHKNKKAKLPMQTHVLIRNILRKP